MKRITQGGHDVTDEQTHMETHCEFTDVGERGPQKHERLCAWRKAQGLEGETRREMLEEKHKGAHGEKDDESPWGCECNRKVRGNPQGNTSKSHQRATKLWPYCRDGRIKRIL